VLDVVQKVISFYCYELNIFLLELYIRTLNKQYIFSLNHDLITTIK